MRQSDAWTKEAGSGVTAEGAVSRPLRSRGVVEDAGAHAACIRTRHPSNRAVEPGAALQPPADRK